MKLIFIIYNAAIEAEVQDCFEECGLKSYTKITRMQGAGTHSDPHLDNAVWPGFNNGFFIAVPDEKKDRLLEKIRLFKEKNLSEGIKAFVVPIEEVV